MDRLNPPEPLSLSGNVGVVWKKWRQRFHIYMVASGLDSQPDEVKTSVLLHSIRTDALDVYNTFPVVDEVSQEDGQEEPKFDRSMSNFDKYFLPRLNVIPMSVIDSLQEVNCLKKVLTNMSLIYVSWRKLVSLVLLVNQ